MYKFVQGSGLGEGYNYSRAYLLTRSLMCTGWCGSSGWRIAVHPANLLTRSLMCTREGGSWGGDSCPSSRFAHKESDVYRGTVEVGRGGGHLSTQQMRSQGAFYSQIYNTSSTHLYSQSGL